MKIQNLLIFIFYFQFQNMIFKMIRIQYYISNKTQYRELSYYLKEKQYFEMIPSFIRKKIKFIKISQQDIQVSLYI